VHAPYALKFRYAAFVKHIAEEEKATGVDASSIVVVDLSRRPSKRRPHEAITVGGAQFEDQSLYEVKQIVLTRRASIGWSQIGQGGGRGLHGQIFAQVGATRRVLSEAPGLDLMSLRLCGHGHAFCWRENGVLRSAVVD
jgi:hypothetical protein